MKEVTKPEDLGWNLSQRIYFWVLLFFEEDARHIGASVVQEAIRGAGGLPIFRPLPLSYSARVYRSLARVA